MLCFLCLLCSLRVELTELTALQAATPGLPRHTVAILQIEARGTLTGEKVEHQRSTFVKQLKLGKVGHPRLCSPHSQGEGRGGALSAPALSKHFLLPLPAHLQLPQCLCIHLQRLSWSSHGTPLKRHEHVQFNEFLMMDFYKYRLLGHKPSQHGPKATENPGSAPEVQDAQAAPKPGVCVCVCVCVCV